MTLVLVVVVEVVDNFDTLVSLASPIAVIAAVLIVALSALVAWLVPAPRPLQVTSSLVTLNRATSIGLLVVSRSLADNPGVFLGIVIFALVQTFSVLGLAFFLRLPFGSTRQTDQPTSLAGH